MCAVFGICFISPSFSFRFVCMSFLCSLSLSRTNFSTAFFCASCVYVCIEAILFFLIQFIGLFHLWFYSFCVLFFLLHLKYHCCWSVRMASKCLKYLWQMQISCHSFKVRVCIMRIQPCNWASPMTTASANQDHSLKNKHLWCAFECYINAIPKINITLFNADFTLIVWF